MKPPFAAILDRRHQGYGASRSHALKRKTVAPSGEHIPRILNCSKVPQRSGIFERRWGVSTTNRIEWCDDIVDDGRRFDLHEPPRFWFVGGKAAKDERDRLCCRSVVGASEVDECLSEPVHAQKTIRSATALVQLPGQSTMLKGCPIADPQP
jgi:hypothetical protein